MKTFGTSGAICCNLHFNLFVHRNSLAVTQVPLGLSKRSRVTASYCSSHQGWYRGSKPRSRLTIDVFRRWDAIHHGATDWRVVILSCSRCNENVARRFNSQSQNHHGGVCNWFLWEYVSYGTSTTFVNTILSFVFLTSSSPSNSLFSICRFKEVTGNYPKLITMVSFTFKQSRFETMHAQALQFPAANFHYIGADPPLSTGFDLEASRKGEYQNAVQPFESDPYGCHTPVLREKRRSRNPFSRTPPYELSCPEMKDLLHHCGPELYPRDKVPWKHLWLAPS